MLLLHLGGESVGLVGNSLYPRAALLEPPHMAAGEGTEACGRRTDHPEAVVVVVVVVDVVVPGRHGRVRMT
jgi:hypothetical protein